MPGDVISVTTRIESVSEEKQTALGAGRFVDEVMTYRDQRGEEVARMRFRILKFKPRAAAATAGAAARPPRARRRPRPARSHDNAFFWEGVDAARAAHPALRGLQEAAPPARTHVPALPLARVGLRDAPAGAATSSRYVVAHHPPIPPFDYPNLIALVELEEGTRLVSNLVGVGPSQVEIGMPVEVEFTQVDPELVLPLFRPARAGN